MQQVGHFGRRDAACSDVLQSTSYSSDLGNLCWRDRDIKLHIIDSPSLDQRSPEVLSMSDCHNRSFSHTLSFAN